MIEANVIFDRSDCLDDEMSLVIHGLPERLLNEKLQPKATMMLRRRELKLPFPSCLFLLNTRSR